MTQSEVIQSSIRGLCSAVILQAVNDTLTKSITCKDGKYQEAYRKEAKKEARAFLQGDNVELWLRWGGLDLNIPHVKKVARYRADYLKLKITKAERKIAENNKDVYNRMRKKWTLDKAI